MKRWAFLGLALLFAGCAPRQSRIYFGEMGNDVCKHCNCYMPAKYDPAARCEVCSCGKTYAECL